MSDLLLGAVAVFPVIAPMPDKTPVVMRSIGSSFIAFGFCSTLSPSPASTLVVVAFIVLLSTGTLIPGVVLRCGAWITAAFVSTAVAVTGA